MSALPIVGLNQAPGDERRYVSSHRAPRPPRLFCYVLPCAVALPLVAQAGEVGKRHPDFLQRRLVPAELHAPGSRHERTVALDFGRRASGASGARRDVSGSGWEPRLLRD